MVRFHGTRKVRPLVHPIGLLLRGSDEHPAPPVLGVAEQPFEQIRTEMRQVLCRKVHFALHGHAQASTGAAAFRFHSWRSV